MAGKGFDVDTNVLKAQGEAFARIADSFDSTAKKFDKTLKGLEEPWGDDQIQLVSELLLGYGSISEGIRGSFESLTNRLKAIGEGLEYMAKEHDTTDEGHYRDLMKAAQQHHS
ncbi:MULTISPECIES: hypothetical protein [unclassified Streptomyces]|uniref:hypothetical protein n=1 Tax=unclassified Streptomyces TaxID=2593676 RepID=UPI00278C1B28|nr:MULTISPECIES: hypothetical protein [unclassified Streptomyces]